MADNKSYKTENRKRILEYLQSHADQTVSVQDIYGALQKEQVEINVSTIYRYLNKLSEDGMVNKYVAKKGEMALFQLVSQNRDCQHHLHLQCSKCGRVIHLECGFMAQISNHILEHHGFQLQCQNSILFGLCQECRNQAK